MLCMEFRKHELNLLLTCIIHEINLLLTILAQAPAYWHLVELEGGYLKQTKLVFALLFCLPLLMGKRHHSADLPEISHKKSKGLMRCHMPSPTGGPLPCNHFHHLCVDDGCRYRDTTGMWQWHLLQ